MIAVLDTATVEATVIGYVDNETEAIAVWRAYMCERMDAEDFANFTVPQMIYRLVGETVIGAPAYEPLEQKG